MMDFVTSASDRMQDLVHTRASPHSPSSSPSSRAPVTPWPPARQDAGGGPPRRLEGPSWLSGRDAGLRLARPERWAAQYNIAFSRFRAVDRARLVHGTLTGLDEEARTVTVRSAGGASTREPYDVLLLATGVRNGVWRRPELRDQGGIDEHRHALHARVAAAGSIAIVGGGPAATGMAAQLAERFPGKHVSLSFPRDRALTRHHPRVGDVVRPRLERLGVYSLRVYDAVERHFVSRLYYHGIRAK
ncbi:FAD-dependent oxidoreductase [Actinoplanes sp. RD1]|uniref:FAD-dependent oxidoreductase n=1 Tax=Actinoplanes sp. RD1 TaxID=3064538 RepID=UPI0027414789|nr:FAD-dependent oxidoreductase [Actinoplanes sp. RD1]